MIFIYKHTSTQIDMQIHACWSVYIVCMYENIHLRVWHRSMPKFINTQIIRYAHAQRLIIHTKHVTCTHTHMHMHICNAAWNAWGDPQGAETRWYVSIFGARGCQESGVPFTRKPEDLWLGYSKIQVLACVCDKSIFWPICLSTLVLSRGH